MEDDAELAEIAATSGLLTDNCTEDPEDDFVPPAMPPEGGPAEDSPF